MAQVYLLGKAMQLALMQPYFFPYLGYFQLIHAADLFVIYDDVQFVHRGWVNRNRILLNNEAAYINLPLQSASRTALISERRLAANEMERARTKLLGQLQSAYKHAPFYNPVRDLVASVMAFPETDLTGFLENSLRSICAYLDIKTEIKRSSSIPRNDTGLRGQERTILLCKTLQADTYINPAGGVELYSDAFFSNENIRLLFIQMDDISYLQFQEPFIPFLSIIDVMMFNSTETIHNLLNRYQLVKEKR